MKPGMVNATAVTFATVTATVRNINVKTTSVNFTTTTDTAATVTTTSNITAQSKMCAPHCLGNHFLNVGHC